MNKIVMDLLKTLGYPVAYITYSGTDDKYFVFNYVTEEGLLFADDKAIYDTYPMQIHFFCPLSFNHLTIKKQVKDLLINNGFLYPTIRTFYEKETKYNHLVFETEKEIYNG